MLEEERGAGLRRDHAFVGRDGPPPEHAVRQARSRSHEEARGEVEVIEDDTLVVADVGTHHEPTRGSDRRGRRLCRLDARDQLGALVLGAQALDRPEQRFRRFQSDHVHKSMYHSFIRQGLPGLMAVGLLLAEGPARADETFEVAPYAAWRRPLAPPFSPGPPPIRRSIAGAAVEWTDAPAPERNGWVLRFGGAVEHQADCPTSASCPFPSGGGPRRVDLTERATTLPENHVEWGAHARGGWFWRSLQLEGGLLAYTTSIAGSPPRPREVMILPDAVARVGSRMSFVALGFGSFTGASVLTPMTYLQGQLLFAERWTTTFTLAAHSQPLASRDVDPYMHIRHDAALRYRVNRAIRVGVGLALTHNDPDAARTRLGGEMRLMFEWCRPEQ